MTVYADLLFIVNLYIDALLLSAVRRFLRLPLTGKRLLLASVLGGGFGLSALLPALPGVVLFPLALLESLALCATAFAPKPMTQLLKAVFLLFLFGAALSGLLSRLLVPAGGAEKRENLALGVCGCFAVLGALLLWQHYFIGPVYTI